MEDLNNTGKIKLAILGVFFLPNLLFPLNVHAPLNLGMLLMPIIFGSIAIPLIAKFNQGLGAEISKPNWNDKLTITRPLVLFHFAAYFFLTAGLSVMMGTLIKFKNLNSIGLNCIFFGIGILLGISIALKWKR